MKTLDEVIDALSECFDEKHIITIYECDPETGCDALHYLKDMKNLERDYDILYNKYWREFNQQQTNPALTWDELKTMEGKPVWFEVTDPKALPALDSGWGIVGCTSFTTWEGVESFSLVKVGVTYAVPIAQYGRAWNVYRKERE